MDKKAQILIVEDQQPIMETIQEIIESAGYISLQAVNGADALQIAFENQVDMILLDLGLPDISGHQVLAQVHAQKPDLPIIVISSMLDMQERLACFEAGADDFIAKPFHRAETLARIERSLRLRSVQLPEQISRGRLTMIYTERALKIDGKLISVRQKLFEILFLFASNPHKVYSRNEIASAIWKEDFVSDNSIWVHINQVRKLLEEFGENVGKLETVSGSGYRYLYD